MKQSREMDSRYLNTAAMIGVWLFVYFLAAIASRDALNSQPNTSSSENAEFLELKWVELAMVQHLLGTVLALMLAQVMRKSILSPALDNKLVIFVAAICNVVGNLAFNATFMLAPSSVAHLVESCQPLVTFSLVLMVYKRKVSLDASTFLSVSILVLGVCVFPVAGNTSFNLIGLAAAGVSTIAFSTRNILVKSLDEDPVQKFLAISIVSAFLIVPVWLIKVAATQTVSATGAIWLTVSGFLHPIYYIASFKVLENVASPVTHAITAILVQLTRYEVTDLSWLFNDVWKLAVSVLVLLIGFYFYQQRKLKCLWLKLFILFTITCLSMQCQIPNLLVHIRGDLRHRISMVWLYEDPVPQCVASNIQTLAEHNPNMDIHVYCGTSQCVGAISELNHTNVEAELTVVSDILKNTPLSHIELLAGAKFETHLHEVTILGILWKYGGFYVNPAVTNRLTVEIGNSAWVSNKGNVLWPDNDLPLDFAMAYFPHNDSLLSELLRVYASKYPKKGQIGKLFRFNFRNMVWKVVKSKCKSDCPASYEKGALDSMVIDNQSNFCSFNSTIGTTASTSQYHSFIDTIVDSSNKLKVYKTNVAMFSNSGWAFFEEKWPPPDDMAPIVTLPVHADNSTEIAWKKNIEYLKKRQPVGCRDSRALNLMQQNGIQGFLSASLLLLMKTPNISSKGRSGVIVTDLRMETVKLLPSSAQKAVLHVKQDVGNKQLVTRFGSARIVVTGNLDHALMCAGMGTPVIFMSTLTENQTLLELTHTAEITALFHTLHLKDMTKQQTMLWFGNFSWHDIPPNPNLETLMRFKSTLWDLLQRKREFYEAAVKFYIIPMPPLVVNRKRDLLFHLIFTTSEKQSVSQHSAKAKQSGKFNWRHMRTVESIFLHHPTSRIIVHSNTLSQDTFDVLTEVGYSITVQKYDLKTLLKDSPAEFFTSKLAQVSKGSNWYSHETDLVRLLILYRYGGVYMDTDMILVRRLDTLPMNTLGYQNKANNYANGAIMIFEKNNSYIRACLVHFAHNYGAGWGSNGPVLLTKVWAQFQNRKTDEVHVMKQQYFYMISWQVMVKQGFEQTSGVDFDRNMRILKTEAYSVHLNSKLTGYIGLLDNKLKPGTIGSYVLNSYCVLCGTIH